MYRDVTVDWVAEPNGVAAVQHLCALGWSGMPKEWDDVLVQWPIGVSSHESTEKAAIAAMALLIHDLAQAEIVSRAELDGVPGAFIEPTQVEFANGVKVIINPSGISDDYILLYGVSQGGMSVTSPPVPHCSWASGVVSKRRTLQLTSSTSSISAVNSQMFPAGSRK